MRQLETKIKNQFNKVSQTNSGTTTENSEAVPKGNLIGQNGAVTPEAGNLVSVREVSKMTGYHRDYVTFLPRTGKLKAGKVGRSWVFQKADVQQLIQNN